MSKYLSIALLGLIGLVVVIPTVWSEKEWVPVDSLRALELIAACKKCGRTSLLRLSCEYEFCKKLPRGGDCAEGVPNYIAHCCGMQLVQCCSLNPCVQAEKCPGVSTDCPYLIVRYNHSSPIEDYDDDF